MTLVETLPLKLYPLNLPYAVLYSKVIPQRDLSSAFSLPPFCCGYLSRSPDEFWTSEQELMFSMYKSWFLIILQHAMSFYNNMCLLNYPAMLAALMKSWRVSKACPAYLLSSVQSSRTSSSWTFRFSLFDQSDKRQQSDKVVVPYSTDVSLVQCGSSWDQWEGSLGQLLLTPTARAECSKITQEKALTLSHMIRRMQLWIQTTSIVLKEINTIHSFMERRVIQIRNGKVSRSNFFVVVAVFLVKLVRTRVN